MVRILVAPAIVQSVRAKQGRGIDCRGQRDAGQLVAAEAVPGGIEARWTKEHGKSYFGYKLIRKPKVGTASEHDTNHFEDVLDTANTSRAVRADKGYVDGERETRLTDAGWRMFIQPACRDSSRLFRLGDLLC